ncbi:alpha/beta hydrolase [Aurantibacter sp.]|uniref:alpha/beta hydrolase n=1 Tax=Aurantibacter sp. TaxID=2807103 RepID=UPI0035C80C1E
MSFSKIFCLFICMSFFSSMFSQSKKTFKYVKNDSTKLKLDIFLPKSKKKDTTKTPLVIYVHGGGFSERNRKDGYNLCKYLAENNIAAATIDYTLFMKGKDFGCNGTTEEKKQTILNVANQIKQATSFLIEKNEKLKIDTSKIFLAGTSAGAESILHSAYILNEFNTAFPEDFKYAGLIAGSGALLDINLITPENKIPMFLFHGKNDTTVPYKTGSHRNCPKDATGYLSLAGSYSITKHVEDLNGSCQLFTIENGEHQHGDTYFYYQHHYITRFIEDVLLGDPFIRYEVKQIVKR